MVEQLGMHQENSQDYSNNMKGGMKRGRRNLQESIQIMGEMLVNTGRVIPLSVVFQKINQVTQR